MNRGVQGVNMSPSASTTPASPTSSISLTALSGLLINFLDMFLRSTEPGAACRNQPTTAEECTAALEPCLSDVIAPPRVYVCRRGYLQHYWLCPVSPQIPHRCPAAAKHAPARPLFTHRPAPSLPERNMEKFLSLVFKPVDYLLNWPVSACASCRSFYLHAFSGFLGFKITHK